MILVDWHLGQCIAIKLNFNLYFTITMQDYRLPVRFAIALLEELKGIIYANNKSIVPPVCYAAKRNPWFAQNIHATNFFCSIELICLIC